MAANRFQDKRVLVTGGARGIGAATALAFLRDGARVAIGATSRGSCDAFIATLQSSAERACVSPAIGDIGSQQKAAAVIAQATDALGGLDVLVNAAGVFAEVKVEDVDQTHWDLTINTNLAGTFLDRKSVV